MAAFVALVQWEAAHLWKGIGLRALLVAVLVLSVAAALLGQTYAYDVILPHNSLPVLWQVYLNATTLLGLLILVIATELLLKDRRDRIEEVLATAPIGTVTFALAKFVVVLGAAILVTVVFALALLGTQIAGYLLGSGAYPTISISPYLQLWVLLPLPAAVIASALSFLGTVLFGNRRLVLYLVFTLLWLAPYTNALPSAYPDVIGHKYANDVASVYYGKIENSFAGRARDLAQQAGGSAGGDAPGQLAYTLEPLKTPLLEALNTWPPLGDFVLARMGYVAVAGLFVAFGCWRFRRFQL